MQNYKELMVWQAHRFTLKMYAKRLVEIKAILISLIKKVRVTSKF